MMTAKIVIKGIPKEMKSEFKNIAKNTGTTMSAILKHEMRKMIDAQPEHMKRRRME